MIALETQEQFEELWQNDPDAQPPHPSMRPHDRSWIVYFTATWCNACKNLNMADIAKVAAEKQLPVFVCNQVNNDYTSGYCGVKVFPTFMHFKPKQIVGALSSSNTEVVIKWLNKID
jgi:hypothetical protein